MEAQVQHPRPATAKAAGLNNILNNDDQPLSHGQPPSHLRDSGFYSTAEASSKHNSTASFNVNVNVNGLSPTASGSGYQSSSADKTPSPVAPHVAPHTSVSPPSGHMSVASMVSHATNGADHRYERPTSTESAGPHHAHGDNLTPGASRRESVDSRINQGISDMRLGNSPYASANQSTTSIQNSLSAQRNPRPGLETLSVHRISNGYQPNAERNPDKIIRTAPTITGPATSHIARAAEPTKGQAWAFPEEEVQRYDDSRRSSITESIASSQFTADSRFPPGQRPLSDHAEYAPMAGASGDFPPVHHHSMQHRQLSDLQSETGSMSAGAQPYSRTPELRVSHKLAERKRRTEMKELFDQLRDLMPQERGSKASKWEILTKAIAEHQKLADHCRALQTHYNQAVAENDMLRRELQGREMHGRMDGPPPPPTAQGPPPAQPYSDPYANNSRTELPPLRSISSSIHSGPDTMTGVQYEAPRPSTNGYRPAERY